MSADDVECYFCERKLHPWLPLAIRRIRYRAKAIISCFECDKKEMKRGPYGDRKCDLCNKEQRGFTSYMMSELRNDFINLCQECDEEMLLRYRRVGNCISISNDRWVAEAQRSFANPLDEFVSRLWHSFKIATGIIGRDLLLLELEGD